jgi:autotransporter-associated beta strand protein
MKNKRKAIEAISAALLGFYALRAGSAQAVDTLSFSTSAAGATKSIATWGYDTSWADYDNVRQSISSMGVNNIGVVRLNFFTEQPLVANANGTFSLSAAAQSEINTQLSLISLANPGTPLTLMPTVGSTDSSYLSSSGGINVNNWAQLIETTQQYINSQPGFANTKIADIEPFNEPDYWSGEGTPAQLNSVIQQLKSYAPFANTTFVAASTLDSDNAQSWYSQIPLTDAGSSHLLGGSLTSYINFIQSVNASGKPFINPEMHSLGEAIVGANYGQSVGIFWADALQARGQFVQTSGGKQLGYAQDLNSQSAAAVYRGPNGSEQIFAGGLERFGSATSYRFVATDRDAYFNGVGPMKSYTLQTNANQDVSSTNNDFANFGAWSVQGAYANVEFGSPTTPGLDGYRWTIQNTLTGQVLSVINSNTSQGALVNSANGTGLPSQMWNITQTPDGYLELFNSNSGLTLEDAYGSLNSGSSVWQYGTANNEFQQWYINSAGNGTFYIRNAYSNEYLTSNSTNVTQNNLGTVLSGLQTWKFVLANPTSPAIAHYKFEGNALDSAGTFNANVTGNPTYITGPTGHGQAISLNGTDSYLTLPVGVANSSSAITVDTWVKWNGGNAWQRIFDFGTGTSSYFFLTPDSAAGTMRFGITTGGTATEEDIDTDELTTGQWVNLALTLGGQTAILYVNGRPVSAGQVRFNPAEINATNDYIGKSQYASDPLFNGAIDDFQIFNYALTPSQVQDIINNNLTWVGGQNGSVWDAGTTANFKLTSGGSSSVFTQGDRVTFDGTGTSSVSINGTVTPFSVTVNSSTNITFNGSGAISGSGTTITKSGTGTLLIANTGSNNYTGDTTILGGTLALQSSGALGTSSVSLEAGGTLASASNGSGTTLSNAIFADGGNITGGTGTLLQINGNIAGSGPLGLSAILNASGLRLGGDDSSYLGTVTITGANVRLGSANAGSAAAAWVVNGVLQTDVTGGATFQLGALSGSGGISGHAINASVATSTLSVGALNTNTTFSGVIVDNAADTAATGNSDGAKKNMLALTKVGTGTLTLNGSNTYSGATTIAAGTLQLGGGAATGALSPASAIADNGTLAFNRSNSITQGSDFGTISGTGGLTVLGGIVTLNTANSYTGATVIGGGSLVVNGAVNATSNLYVQHGSVTINGGASVISSNYSSIGQNAGNSATLNVSGGSLTVNGDFNIGDVSATGALNITGNATIRPQNFYVGKYGTSDGTVIQTGGSVVGISAGSDWRIGGAGSASDSAAAGIYNMSGGTFNCPSNLQVGAFGTGTFIQTGGVVSVGNYLSIGRFAGGVGTYDMSSGNGILNANTTASMLVGEQGTGLLKVGGTSVVNVQELAIAASDGGACTGTVLQTGGTVNAPTGVIFGAAAGNTTAPIRGYYNLSGGTLSTFSISQNTDSSVSGTVTFNGGVLSSTGSNSAFVQGLSHATVLAGGAIFNTNGYNVTVAQSLVSGGGIDGGVTKQGAGSLALTGLNTYTGPTTVNAGILSIGANTGSGGVLIRSLGGINLASGASMTVGSSISHANRTLLVVSGNGLNLSGNASTGWTSSFNIGSNDLDIVNGSLPILTSELTQGFNHGKWNGSEGILSSSAATDPAHLTTLGMALNSVTGSAGGSPLYGSGTTAGLFDGANPASSDVLVKYTYYGDANLDGQVDGSDYTLIDNAFNHHGSLTGWYNGDFNYDGVIDGSDYTLIDNAFNTQGGNLRSTAQIASITDQIAGKASVPEPAEFGVVLLVAAALRRRRKFD